MEHITGTTKSNNSVEEEDREKQPQIAANSVVIRTSEWDYVLMRESDYSMMLSGNICEIAIKSISKSKIVNFSKYSLHNHSIPGPLHPALTLPPLPPVRSRRGWLQAQGTQKMPGKSVLSTRGGGDENITLWYNIKVKHTVLNQWNNTSLKIYQTADYTPKASLQFGKISIVFKDFSRNPVFFRTE